MSTGWNNGLSQDYNRQLFNWFASRIDARYVLRCVCLEIEMDQIFKASEMSDFVNVWHSRYHIQYKQDNQWITAAKFDDPSRAFNMRDRLVNGGSVVRIVDIES